jgi:hypothetical protein
MADDGRVFVGDCGSPSGTWAREAAGWQPLRQAFVAMGDTLRFGDHECVLADVMAPILPNPRPAVGTGRETARTGGRMSRDPWTGEIVRRGR